MYCAVVWQRVIVTVFVLCGVSSATGYISIFRKSVDKFQVSLNLTRTIGTPHEDNFTFFIISRSILLRIRQTKFVQKMNACVVFNNFFV